MKRFLLFAAFLLVLFIGLYGLADHYGYTDEAAARAALERLHASPYGDLAAGGAVVGLLAVDLLLPVPSSVVMTLSGAIFGVWTGTALSFAGAMLAAALGFYACRLGGRAWFVRLSGTEDTKKIDAWFRTYGAYAIVLSRPVPMLTEVLSCLAGLSGMSAGAFFAAVTLGTLPVCGIYAWCGAVSSPGDPWPAVLVSLLVPAAGWVAVRRIKRGRTEGEE